MIHPRPGFLCVVSALLLAACGPAPEGESPPAAAQQGGGSTGSPLADKTFQGEGGSCPQAAGDGQPGGAAKTVFNARCSFFFRPSVNEAPGPGTVIEVGENHPGKTVAVGDFNVILTYTASESFPINTPSGGSLYVDIASVGNQGFLRTLYQISPANLPSNVFAGQHGFSGLHYVTHATTGSELQYICEAM